MILLGEWSVAVEVPSHTSDVDAAKVSALISNALSEWTAEATQRLSGEAGMPVQVYYAG